MYWARKGNSIKKGLKAPKQDTLYVKYVHHELDKKQAHPFYSYFDNVTQLAGYIKYVVLGGIAMGLLNDEQVLDYFRNRTTFYSVADVEESLEQAEPADDVDVMVKNWLQEILAVCNAVVLEKDFEEQKILLKRVEFLFNKYFSGTDYSEPTGEIYELRLFFGMKEAKHELLTYYREHYKYEKFKALLSKSEWTWAETEEVKKILNGY